MHSSLHARGLFTGVALQSCLWFFDQGMLWATRQIGTRQSGCHDNRWRAQAASLSEFPVAYLIGMLLTTSHSQRFQQNWIPRRTL